MKKLITALAFVLTFGSAQIAEAKDWRHDNDRDRHGYNHNNHGYNNNHHNNRVIIRNHYSRYPYYQPYYAYSPYNAGFWSPPGYYYPSYGTSLSFNFR